MEGALLLLLIACWRGAAPAEAARACEAASTTASGSRAPSQFCKGDLIFDEEFSTLDLAAWEHEVTLAGGGNWEFQLYGNNRSNSYAEDGRLYLTPSLTAEQYGEAFLSSGTISLYGGAPADTCTNPADYGCSRTGSTTNILNPVKSARIRTINSFRFKYGRVEIKAKMPSGDWLWPGMWMLPLYNAYSTWPASGEIDLAESRGNANYVQDGVNIGSEQVASTLHFGPYSGLDAYERAHFQKNAGAGGGYDKEFHLYQMEWTADHIKFSLDGVEMGTVTPPSGGFWELGNFNSVNPSADNPWRGGTKMAPFDQEFYILLNLAVGGVNGYFPDSAANPKSKPWLNTSPQASTDFWNGRADWLPTWGTAETKSLQVDWVKVWAV
ncbi:beta-1,3-glucan-binding protein-like [Bacillus rossius redtenbacheri]|uniref:beta-1,3-glucan-binding protein-like n=1 Tax=Bacillus rossius redtenbacheri TaxID=93214 RepID=UPI002FDE3139